MTRSRCFALSVCLGWLLFSPADTQSCYTCPEFEFSILTVAGRDLIFSGRVLKVTPHPQTGPVSTCIEPPTDYLFAVKEVWKGDVTDTVAIRGGYFEKDKVYLVLASRGNISFYVDPCDEKPLLSKASRFLTLLNSLPCRGPARDVDRAIVQSFIGLTHSKYESTRVAAAETLGYIAKEPDLTLPALLELYHHGQGKERAAAVGALALCYDEPTSLSFLKTAFKDQDPHVRAKALFSLERVGASREECWSGLHDPAPAVRVAAIRVLPYEFKLAATPYLLEAIRDSSAGVRAASAFRMADFRYGDECEPALLRASFDSSRLVSISAMCALATMNRFSECGERGEATLVEAVSDPSPYVSSVAFNLLLSVGTETSIQKTMPIAMSNPDPKQREWVVEGLLYHYDEEPQLFRVCTRALSDSSPSIRELALEHLDRATYRCSPRDPPIWIADDVRLDLIFALMANARSGQPYRSRWTALEVLDALSAVKESLSVFREAATENEDEDIRTLARQSLHANGIDPDDDPR